MKVHDDAVTGTWGEGAARWSILVHGGAGDVAPERRPLHVAGCERAAAAGAAVLAAGGSALDAVQRAVEVLEDDPIFNAGTGACLNADGTIELDAALMDGATLRAGGVCALPPFRNPIAIARCVMDETSHALLAGGGAARFAVEHGFVPVEPGALITDHARARWEAVRAKGSRASGKGESAGGTVGAVARDPKGHVAAATSTGGMVNKLAGRVGDSPLLGAGTYADEMAACSTTGHGEAMMRVCLAKTITDAVRTRLLRPVDAALDGVAAMRARTGEAGGAIVASADGATGLARTTQTMSWAAVVLGEGAGAAPRTYSGC